MQARLLPWVARIKRAMTVLGSWAPQSREIPGISAASCRKTLQDPTLYFTARDLGRAGITGEGAASAPWLAPERPLQQVKRGNDEYGRTDAARFHLHRDGHRRRGRRGPGRLAVHRPDESVRRRCSRWPRSRSTSRRSRSASNRSSSGAAIPSSCAAAPRRRSPRPKRSRCPTCPIRSRATSTCPTTRPRPTRTASSKPEWLIVIGVCTHLGCTRRRNRG